MKIFVTGATGYIGFAVARALRRVGHDVYGLCRTQDKAIRLSRHEVLPVAGDITRPESFRAVAEDCAVLVHCAADLARGSVQPDRTAIDALLAAAERRGQATTIVYTSGVWVYGDTGHGKVDETATLSPARLVAWRPEHEALVLSARSARPIVLRPGCVYGGPGGLTASWFDSARRESAVRFVGGGEQRWAMVHVEDLADAYVRAVESTASGIFNVTDRSRNSVRAMADAVARVAGPGVAVQAVPVDEAAHAMGDFAACLALDQHVDSSRAARVLGWQPRHGGFVDGVVAYHEAWRAHQPLES